MTEYRGYPVKYVKRLEAVLEAAVKVSDKGMLTEGGLGALDELQNGELWNAINAVQTRQSHMTELSPQEKEILDAALRDSVMSVCVKCKRAYSGIGRPLCPDCITADSRQCPHTTEVLDKGGMKCPDCGFFVEPYCIARECIFVGNGRHAPKCIYCNKPMDLTISADSTIY